MGDVGRGPFMAPLGVSVAIGVGGELEEKGSARVRSFTELSEHDSGCPLPTACCAEKRERGLVYRLEDGVVTMLHSPRIGVDPRSRYHLQFLAVGHDAPVERVGLVNVASFLFVATTPSASQRVLVHKYSQDASRRRRYRAAVRSVGVEHFLLLRIFVDALRAWRREPSLPASLRRATNSSARRPLTARAERTSSASTPPPAANTRSTARASASTLSSALDPLRPLPSCVGGALAASSEIHT